MRILIIGRGGREHALAHSAFKSKLVSKVYVAPGNDGMCDIATRVDIEETDNKGLVLFAIENKIDLTIVGPELALSNGIVDEFVQANLKIFGPTKKAAKIESSKWYAKELMKKNNIPTADYEVFNCCSEAIKYVEGVKLPVVIKYDGLASGKGVVIVNSLEQAKITLNEMLNENKYGDGRVIIEEYLDGVEFSLMAFVNSEDVYPMEISQDHKRAFNNDEGPNTGGMGAYSPVPMIDDEMVAQGNAIMNEIALAMKVDNNAFCGFLYGGLIATKDGVKVIEFNARFGDPEAEVLLPRLESDFVEVILNVLDCKQVNLVWSKEFVVGVVIASQGYPQKYETGYVINGVNLIKSSVYCMGVKVDKNYYTNGGRVLLVNGRGQTLKEARDNAYSNVVKIECKNTFYRDDIGDKGLTY